MIIELMNHLALVKWQLAGRQFLAFGLVKEMRIFGDMELAAKNVT